MIFGGLETAHISHGLESVHESVAICVEDGLKDEVSSAVIQAQ